MEKKICFFDRHYKKDSEGFGSGAMRTTQIYNALIKHKYNTFLFNFSKQESNIKNSYIICVKTNNGLNLEKIKIMKNNINKIIFDVLDYYDDETSRTPDIIKNGFVNYIDYFIVNNNFMKQEFKKYKKPIFVIPHHYDPRLNNISIKKIDSLKFIFNGYIGDKNKNCLYINELTEKYNLIVCDDFRVFIKKFLFSNYCFISIREEGSWEYNNRPLMKLAHAAACDSNIIITNDMSVRDLLDPSYPYLLKDHKYETVIEMFEFVKKTFNTDIWFKGLDILKNLKIKLNSEQIVLDYYIPMFSKL